MKKLILAALLVSNMSFAASSTIGVGTHDNLRYKFATDSGVYLATNIQYKSSGNDPIKHKASILVGYEYENFHLGAGVTRENHHVNYDTNPPSGEKLGNKYKAIGEIGYSYKFVELTLNTAGDVYAGVKWSM